MTAKAVKQNLHPLLGRQVPKVRQQGKFVVQSQNQEPDKFAVEGVVILLSTEPYSVVYILGESYGESDNTIIFHVLNITASRHGVNMVIIKRPAEAGLSKKGVGE